MTRALMICLLAAACAEPPANRGDPRVCDVSTHAGELRPDDAATSDLYRYDRGDDVRAYDSASGHFRIHYTVAGRHSVPRDDTDASGLPDFVELVAATYDEVFTKYHSVMGFRQPVRDTLVPGSNGGNDRFDVYLLDFGGSGDGAFRSDRCLTDHPAICAGFMVQENDFAGYGYSSISSAIRILASHEYFHAIQAAYDSGQGSILAEGTAVWATEQFDPSQRDFENFLPGYLDLPSRSLDVPLPGPVDPFSYGSAIFFQFLSERFGAAVVRELWEACEDGAGGVPDSKWIDVLDDVLAKHESAFPKAFPEFAEWNLYTGKASDPTRSYENGVGYPDVAREKVQLPFKEDRLRVFYASTQYFSAVPAGRQAIAAAIAPTPTALDGTDDVVVTLAVRKGTAWSLKRLQDPTSGAESLASAGADEVVALVVNTLRSGQSRKPAFCFGSPAEVTTCLGKDVPEVPDAGTPDPEPDKQDPPVDDGGCSHSAVTLATLSGLLATAAKRQQRRG